MTEERKKEFDNLCLTLESGIVANFRLALIMAQNYKEEFEEKYQVCYEVFVKAVDCLFEEDVLSISVFKTYIHNLNNLKFNGLRRIIILYLRWELKSRDIYRVARGFEGFKNYKICFPDCYCIEYEEALFILKHFEINLSNPVCWVNFMENDKLQKDAFISLLDFWRRVYYLEQNKSRLLDKLET